MKRILFSSHLVLSLNTIHAQIIYTDINPDSTFYFSGCPSYPCTVPCDVCNDPHYFDLNNDGTNDFSIWISESSSSTSCNGFPAVWWSHSIKVFPADSNSIMSLDGISVNEINFSDTIGSQQSWVDSSLLSMQWYYLISPGACSMAVVGNWVSTGFFGIKFTIGNQYHYGWARAYVDAGASFYWPMSFILYDFAYSSLPNQFILAGDTGTGTTGIIETLADNEINIYPNPFAVVATLTVNSNFKLKNADLKLFDVTGREIKQFEIKNQKTEIKRENLSSGVYFYKVHNENELIGAGKLIIQ
ncbi:MAG: T9SS type A sorting domain-containing protein [Bacteroidia bacterium]